MKWTVEYKSVEEIVIEDAATEDEAIAKAKKMPLGNFHIVENEWSAFEYDSE